MNRHRVMPARPCGFTLIEVLVAFSILSLTLATLFALLSSGARNTQTADEYSRALVLAESKMAELGISEPLRSGMNRGRFNDTYRWELQVDKQQARKVTSSAERDWELLEVSLRVWWQSMGQERDISLSTLRMVALE